ncbi:MAG: glycosyltransferase [Chlorobiales bacterium]|nr:glycosyltransferase [Chlorobiales bacterium]
MQKRKALIIFFKWPRPGSVKTRLVPFLTHEEAAQLYEKFVLDSFETVIKLRQVDLFGYVASDAEEAHSLRAKLDAMSVKIRSQRGQGLGERMSNAFKEIFELGYASVAIVGTDSPDLPISYIEVAFQSLDMANSALCIGPSEDGGYYLLGMNRFFRQVFQGVPYSSSETYRETLRALVPLSLSVFPLRQWYDVDEKKDLIKLMKTMKDGELRNSRQLLESLKVRVGLG